ncbi:tetratricopeptide repeat protein [uncultured Winogradskyella sp.]|uniref:tetratricopeptide repeat protein n=1 Tax=uncultured Winogradskyella sp. TaxID=395353 RepID=UPI00261359B8|nr:tetratricopeptide repeat protein [uncultured Winogradskyella sp.]|tara:strand:- start:588 stop:1352 length:765 start_codon:yes stop_codon:yes gene_type:complete
MATYNKRGYKPKTVKEKEVIVEEDSTTAEVFNTLDEGASKAEEWAVRNQKYIIGIVGIIALLVLAVLAYNKFVAEPNEKDAMNEMYTAKKYFNEAVNGTSADSLYRMSLEGGEGKYGMLDIIENYGGTPAANLANYYAGMAYLNLKDYQNAVEHLDDFSSEDKMLGPIAKGGIGDAFVQLDQSDKALEYYEKAFKANVNDFTTPLYLMKAAKVAIDLGNNSKALDYLTRIKSEFSTSNEAKDADVLIGKVEASL